MAAREAIARARSGAARIVSPHRVSALHFPGSRHPLYIAVAPHLGEQGHRPDRMTHQTREPKESSSSFLGQRACFA